MGDVQIECIEDEFLVTTPPPPEFQVTGGKTQHPKKSLGLPTKPPKIHAELNFRGIKISRKHIEYPRKSLLESSYPKIYLPKFSLPWHQKSRNKKQSFERHCHLKSRVPPVRGTQERGLLQKSNNRIKAHVHET